MTNGNATPKMILPTKWERLPMVNWGPGRFRKMWRICGSTSGGYQKSTKRLPSKQQQGEEQVKSTKKKSPTRFLDFF